MSFWDTLDQAIWTLFALAFGLAIWGGILYLIFSRDAGYWRLLAEPYARPWYRPIAKKGMRSAVVYGGNRPSKSYNGILSIGVHETGVALRVMRPFAFFHKPLFIPFRDIRGWDQDWYINARSVELEFRRAPDLKMVMPASQIKWMQEASGNKLHLTEEGSPHKDRPGWWHALIMIQGILAMCLVIYMLIKDTPLAGSLYRAAIILLSSVSG